LLDRRRIIQNFLSVGFDLPGQGTSFYISDVYDQVEDLSTYRVTISNAISSADLCASRLNCNFATSFFPDATHFAALLVLPPSCFTSVFSISTTTPVQFVIMPVICFCRVCGIDCVVESLTSSARSSRMVLRNYIEVAPSRADVFHEGHDDEGGASYG
jgi:hypothetical protein